MSRPLNRKLDPDVLLRAYASGIFPMAEASDSPDVFWVEPRRRGVLPLDEFHPPRSLLKALKRDQFYFTHDLTFAEVLAACAAPGPGRPQTWINGLIHDACIALHARGQAHSIEAWTADGRLAGGLYGVRLGGAFFGESMFTHITDGSKAALAALVVRLRAGGFTLLDTQFLTEHLARFGTREIERKAYRSLLSGALGVAADFGALDRLAPSPLPATTTVSGPVSGHFIAQALTHTS
jgi:leucyl/phenylalanyl-tRNA--protein transferase